MSKLNGKRTTNEQLEVRSELKVELLPPAVVSHHWDKIGPMVMAGFGQLGEEREMYVASNILKALVSGEAYCWSIRRENEPNKVLGIGVTTFTTDKVAGLVNLLIYSLYAEESVGAEAWEAGLRELKDFAKRTGCDRIIAYTSVPSAHVLADRLGANIESSVVQWEVK